MARRGDNIHLRKDGRWEGRFRLPGEKKMRSVYARSFEECKEKRLSAIRTCEPEMCSSESSIPTPANTLLQVLEAWLAFICANRKTSTYAKYQYLCRKYIEAVLREHIGSVLNCNKEIYDRYEITALSVKRCCATILNGIVRYDVRMGMLTPDEFRVTAEYETKSRKKLNVFTREEQDTLINYLNAELDSYKMGIILCCSTGLRLGEICSLKWADVDFRAGILHVNRTVQRLAVDGRKAKTRLVESAPKTESSCRDVPLSDEMVKMLCQCEHTGEYVIGGDHPVDPRTYEYKFHRYQINAGIPAKNFHILRHTFATNCIAIGIDAKTVSEILGHRDVRITLDRYTHPTMDAKRASMNLFAAEYGHMSGQEQKVA